MILLGDFNLDQMKKVNRLIPLKKIFNLQQYSRHSTCQLLGILDFVSDSKFSKSLQKAITLHLFSTLEVAKEIKNWNCSRFQKQQ